MAQTIRRKAKGVRRTAAAQGKARRVKKAKARTGSFIDAVMRFLPFTEEQLQRIFLAIILGGAVALAWIVASMAGVPAMAKQQVDALALDAGFVVKDVSVRGTERLNPNRVYQLAAIHSPMTQVDLEGIRSQLLELSWVKDARVSRRLPDSLVVDIVERKPHAVLRKPDRYMLVDATGHELEPISQANARSYLVIEGPGAARQVPALSELLEAAPAIKGHVASAKWVGNRRWDLTFKTGQVLALPEGPQPAAGALAEFARIDGINRLLEGPAVAFDMRAPDRIYLRVPGRSEMQSLESAVPAQDGEAAPGDGE